MIAVTYTDLALLILTAILVGLALRPLRNTTRAMFRAHRAAKKATAPVRKRKRRKTKRPILY